jgi:hypothetical protein
LNSQEKRRHSQKWRPSKQSFPNKKTADLLNREGKRRHDLILHPMCNTTAHLFFFNLAWNTLTKSTIKQLNNTK